MEHKPVVTVGLCVRNCEATVGEAIESVLDQNFSHELMEIIVVDDGSEDKTLSVVSDILSKSDLSVEVFHSEWMGLGPARNTVVDNAKGEYIVWVDGDMMLPKDHVKKQVEFMEENPKVGIAKAKHGMFSGTNLVATLEDIAFFVVDSKYGGKTTLRALGTGGCIYRVKALRQVGGFDHRIKGSGEDTDIEHRISEAGWSRYLATDAVFYHRRKNTLKALWGENFWYGYGGHYLLHKIEKKVPFAAFSAEFLHSFNAYKLTHQKVAFLLPIQQFFKKIAWFFGFAKAHIQGYGHH